MIVGGTVFGHVEEIEYLLDFLLLFVGQPWALARRVVFCAVEYIELPGRSLEMPRRGILT